MVKAVRGAITVSKNKPDEILSSVRELVMDILTRNPIQKKDIISMFFTMTKDLDAVFPAKAVREMGMDDIPLMCANEINVKGSLGKCIRVMIFFNAPADIGEITHVYLRKAKDLRPDLFINGGHE